MRCPPTNQIYLLPLSALTKSTEPTRSPPFGCSSEWVGPLGVESTLAAHPDRLFSSAGCFGIKNIFARPRPPLVYSRSPTPDRPRSSYSSTDSRDCSPSPPASLITHVGDTRRADVVKAYRYVNPTTSPGPRPSAHISTSASPSRRSTRKPSDAAVPTKPSDADVPTLRVQIDIPNPPHCRCRRRGEKDHQCRWRDQVEAETLAREETRRHRSLYAHTAPLPRERCKRSEVAHPNRSPPSDLAGRPTAPENTASAASHRRSPLSDIAPRPDVQIDARGPGARRPSERRRNTPWPPARPTYHGLNPFKKVRQEAEDISDFARYGVIRRRSPDRLPLRQLKSGAPRQAPGT